MNEEALSFIVGRSAVRMNILGISDNTTSFTGDSCFETTNPSSSWPSDEVGLSSHVLSQLLCRRSRDDWVTSKTRPSAVNLPEPSEMQDTLSVVVHANEAGEDLVFESFLLFLNERDDFSFLNPMVATSWLQLLFHCLHRCIADDIVLFLIFPV
jgi:hypothetical protein